MMISTKNLLIAITVDDTVFFEKICNKILELDPKIRFVGIISELGKLQIGKTRPEVKFLIDDIGQEMLFMEVALRVRMRHEFDISLGPVDFTISQRDKVTVMSLPYKNQVLYVSTEKGINLGMTHKILELIRSQLP